MALRILRRCESPSIEIRLAIFASLSLPDRTVELPRIAERKLAKVQGLADLQKELPPAQKPRPPTTLVAATFRSSLSVHIDELLI